MKPKPRHATHGSSAFRAPKAEEEKPAWLGPWVAAGPILIYTSRYQPRINLTSVICADRKRPCFGFNAGVTRVLGTVY